MVANFDKIFDRTNTASVKWEATKKIYGVEGLLPMWVADMDFQAPKEVTEAIYKRADHGIFGYTFTPNSTVEAIQNWLEKRHHWKIQPEWILYHHGVVPAISTAIQAFTNPGDRVMLQAPVYAPFFGMIKSNDRTVVNAPLELHGNRYQINFEIFEQKLKEGVKLFLLCNPHNPGGNVWTKDELLKIGELCLKHNCLILSDEIHSDLVYKPAAHIPIASLSDELEQQVITCVAPSKTFNLAGLQASAIIIANEKLKRQFNKIQLQQGFFALNTFGIVAMEAGYRYGEMWLEELLTYLVENKRIADHYMKENIPQIKIIEPEGTYLLWLDCRNLGMSDSDIQKALLEKGKLALEPGTKYGTEGSGFLRMNIACPKNTLLEGLDRLKAAFQ